MADDDPLLAEIAACRICAAQFAATATAHRPNPVVWFRHATPILVAGQAPGLRVHRAGRPFFDRSGDRLRDWMGLEAAQFYDRDLVSVLPAAFCFPGYNAKGHDLPPPPICARTWGARSVAAIGPVQVRVLVGGYAQRLHLGVKTGVTETVRNWRAFGPDTFALPHPSWRNNAWLRRNPWFEEDLLPRLRARVAEILTGARHR
ncbi:MAG: uracil-DNA glycosylase family protein [Qingshengfaniella sp.]